MDQINQLTRHHNWITKISAAFFYSIAVSIALNLFWEPGKIYASGITGFAQVIHTLSTRYLPFDLETSTMYLLLNIPLFIIGWMKIGHRFAFYTLIAVIMASFMMHLIPPIKITFDPIICAIFGGLFNGVGTGFALKNGISTGGLDIIGIIVRNKTGRSFGTINIIFNLIIVALAGLVFGWVHALYTALSIFVNGRVIDMIYTQHQKLQVMIVTDKPQEIIDGIQGSMRRGITILHDAEGAFGHAEKTVLFTIIARYEINDLTMIIHHTDPYAFVSITEVVKVIGRFKEPKVE